MSLALAKVAPPPDDGVTAQEKGSTDTGSSARVSSARPFIEFEKVSVRFGKGDKQVQALSETSLSIEEVISSRWSAPPAAASPRC